MKMETRAAFKLRVEKPPPQKKDNFMPLASSQSEPPGRVTDPRRVWVQVKRAGKFPSRRYFTDWAPCPNPPPEWGGADLAGASLGL